VNYEGKMREEAGQYVASSLQAPKEGERSLQADELSVSV